jgi:arginase family enzyme
MSYRASSLLCPGILFERGRLEIDVVEVAPQFDPTTNTAHVAAQLLFELFTLLALRK